MIENKYYGIKDNKANKISALEAKIEEICILGYTVIENYLSSEEINLASSKLDDIYKYQLESFGAKNLQKIDELNMVRSPLLYDEYFLHLVIKPDLVELLKHFLGDYHIINQQNGIINRPNEEHHQSAWHRDLPYQDYVISKPIAISALCCLEDFTENTGGTYVLPFSHNLESIPSINYINKHKATITAKKGSVIVFDAMLYHKSGYNSSELMRRGINTLFSIPLLVQQINLSKQLDGKFSEDNYLRRLLGYDNQTPNSVNDWRINRLNR